MRAQGEVAPERSAAARPSERSAATAGPAMMTSTAARPSPAGDGDSGGEGHVACLVVARSAPGAVIAPKRIRPPLNTRVTSMIVLVAGCLRFATDPCACRMLGHGVSLVGLGPFCVGTILLLSAASGNVVALGAACRSTRIHHSARKPFQQHRWRKLGVDPHEARRTRRSARVSSNLRGGAAGRDPFASVLVARACRALPDFESHTGTPALRCHTLPPNHLQQQQHLANNINSDGRDNHEDYNIQYCHNRVGNNDDRYHLSGAPATAMADTTTTTTTQEEQNSRYWGDLCRGNLLRTATRRCLDDVCVDRSTLQPIRRGLRSTKFPFPSDRIPTAVAIALHETYWNDDGSWPRMVIRNVRGRNGQQSSSTPSPPPGHTTTSMDTGTLRLLNHADMTAISRARPHGSTGISTTEAEITRRLQTMMNIGDVKRLHHERFKPLFGIQREKSHDQWRQALRWGKQAMERRRPRSHVTRLTNEDGSQITDATLLGEAATRYNTSFFEDMAPDNMRHGSCLPELTGKEWGLWEYSNMCFNMEMLSTALAATPAGKLCGRDAFAPQHRPTIGSRRRWHGQRTRG